MQCLSDSSSKQNGRLEEKSTKQDGRKNQNGLERSSLLANDNAKIVYANSRLLLNYDGKRALQGNLVGATNCPVGQIYSNASSSCICNVSANYVTTGNSCTNCGSDGNSPGTAANSTACNCNTGYAWNSTLYKCVISCATGMIYSSASGACVCDTSNNYVLVDGTCIHCLTVGATYFNATTCSCDVGYQWDNSTNNCICAANSQASACQTSSSNLGMILAISIPIGAVGLAGLIFAIIKFTPPFSGFENHIHINH